MKIIFIKAISIILFILLLTGCSHNLPGTPFASVKYVPPSDEAVIKLLEQHKGKTPEELIDVALELTRKGRYKESYNISKIIILGNVQNVDIIADAYAFMGVNYMLIGGYEKAKHYIEKALALIDQFEHPSTAAAVQYNAGVIYYELGIRDDWKYAKEGIKYLEESLSYYIQYSDTRTSARFACSYLHAFYLECPEFFDAEKAADYAHQTLAIDPLGVDWDSTFYTVAMAYLTGGYWERAEEFVENYISRPPIREYFRYSLSLFYHTVKGDMEIAKRLADTMKRVEPFGNAPLLKTSRLSEYPKLAYYSEAIGDAEAAKEYYYEYVNSEGRFTNANAKFFVDAEKRLGMDFSEERARLMQQIIDGRSISLELAGVEDEAAIALGFV